MHDTTVNLDVFVGRCDHCGSTRTLTLVHPCGDPKCCGIGLCRECVAVLGVQDVVEQVAA